jgi:hypothetical protein
VFDFTPKFRDSATDRTRKSLTHRNPQTVRVLCLLDAGVSTSGLPSRSVILEILLRVG